MKQGEQSGETSWNQTEISNTNINKQLLLQSTMSPRLDWRSESSVTYCH